MWNIWKSGSFTAAHRAGKTLKLFMDPVLSQQQTRGIFYIFCVISTQPHSLFQLFFLCFDLFKNILPQETRWVRCYFKVGSGKGSLILSLSTFQPSIRIWFTVWIRTCTGILLGIFVAQCNFMCTRKAPDTSRMERTESSWSALRGLIIFCLS